MKKNITFTTYLALWVIALFSFSIGWTFITEHLQQSGFFADTYLYIQVDDIHGIDVHYDWGIRHYLYQTMCIILFIVYIIRVGLWWKWFWSDNKNKY